MTEATSTRPTTSFSAVPFERLLGRRGADPQSPFLLPDDDAGGNHQAPGGNANPFQGGKTLARHMAGGGERTAESQALDKSSPDRLAGKEPPAASSSRQAAMRTQAVRQDQPTPPRQGNATPRASLAEKAAAQGVRAETRTLSTRSKRTATHSFLADSKSVKAVSNMSGTGSAEQSSAMLRLLLRKQIASMSSGQSANQPVKTEVIARAHALRDARCPRRREEERKEKPAMAVAQQQPEQAAQPTTQQVREAAPTSQLAELPAVIQTHLDRLKQAGRDTVRVAMKLADGTPLNLSLQWRGSRVIAQFAGSTPALRRELERAWGQLVRRAGSEGVQLEPPQFEEPQSTPFAEGAA